MEPSTSDDRTQAHQFSFSRFARQPFYRAVNAHLVDLAGIGQKAGVKVLDLACGTGAVTKIILEKLQGLRESWVIAMDASAEALELARRELSQVKWVRLVQGRAEQLSQSLQETVDAVIFCNAIHMIEQKEQMIREVRHVLAPDGIFAFNTTFFAGSQPAETEQFYRRWMTRAIRTLKRVHGLQPTRDKVAARRQLSPQQYEQLLQQQGFRIHEQRLDPVDVPLEGWLGISEFSDFIQGALPGVPLPEACQVLQEAVSQIFQELKLQAVPRLWLHTVAVRPC
jgi:ubiquinone/menaquinone biosynthesis C-methylase UbiE